MPMLNNYSAVLSFAVDLENKMARYYESAAPFDDLFEEYARRYAKRGQRMVQVRQDHVTEMVLEPISGLDTAMFTVDAAIVPMDRAAAITRAIRLEVNAQKFYAEASSRLNVTEAIRAFQRAAQENGERIIELKSLSEPPAVASEESEG